MGRVRPLGSTDMGNVTNVLPGIHPVIGIDSDGAVTHQPGFAAACVTESADRAVIDGAIALARTAVRAATDPTQRARLLEGVDAGERGSRQMDCSLTPTNSLVAATHPRQSRTRATRVRDDGIRGDPAGRGRTVARNAARRNGPHV